MKPVPLRISCAVIILAILVLLLACSGCLGSSSLTGKAGNSSAIQATTAGSGGAAQPGQTTGTCRQGLTSCSGDCVDISSDIGNCGGCGWECPTNAKCSGSQCFCKDGYTATKEGKCVATTAPKADTAKTSQSRQATYTCDDPLRTACDDGYCWYLTENEHCGSCDNACPVNTICSNGQCVSRTGQTGQNAPAVPGSSSQTTCNGQGVDFQTDNLNCGGCGRSCDTSTTCKVCVQGTCQYKIGTCSYCTNTADCTDIAAERGIDTSGWAQYHIAWSCRKAGSNSFKSCNVDCAAPYTACGFVGNTPNCVNIQTDTANCGGCGNTCSGTCTGGSCLKPVVAQPNAFVVPQQAALSWAGSWTGHTTYNFDMNLAVNTDNTVTGIYANGQGSLTGIVSSDGKVITGNVRWNGGSPMNCQFTMSSDGQSFSGYYSDSSGQHSWTGYR